MLPPAAGGGVVVQFLVSAKQSYDCQRRILEDILAHKRAVTDTV